MSHPELPRLNARSPAEVTNFLDLEAAKAKRSAPELPRLNARSPAEVTEIHPPGRQTRKITTWPPNRYEGPRRRGKMSHPELPRLNARSPAEVTEMKGGPHSRTSKGFLTSGHFQIPDHEAKCPIAGRGRKLRRPKSHRG